MLILKPHTLAPETPWQLPEVVSNLGEDLSLYDKIEPLPDERGLLRQRQQKQLEWERALSEILTEEQHTLLLCSVFTVKYVMQNNFSETFQVNNSGCMNSK